MAEKLVATRKIEWSILNFTMNNVYKGDRNTGVKSGSFEIVLGENITKWRLVFYPYGKGVEMILGIIKDAADNNNFTVHCRVHEDNTRGFLEENGYADAEKIGPIGVPVFLGYAANFFKIIEPSNMLTILIELTLQQHEPPKVRQQNTSVTNDLGAKLFNLKHFSDITLVCSDGKELPAHRCVLSGQSSVFEAMLFTDMAEKKSSRIAVDDIESDAMLEMLRFMYTKEANNLDTIAQSLIYAAEKYNLPELKSICVAEMMNQIKTENVFELLVLADQYNAKILLEKCMMFIQKNYLSLQKSEWWKRLSNDLMMKCMHHNYESFTTIKLPPVSL